MYILTMLILLSILVLVHELGHFGVARALKIKVERFGFGLPFGPTLYETTWRNTKIVVHALLLGGYVSFPDDDPDSDVPKDDPGRISNRKIWERFLVIIAGVTANVIIAYLLVLLVSIISGGVPSGKYNVYVEGTLSDKTLSANHINIEKGDKVISVNGTAIDSPYKFIQITHRSKQFDGYVDYKRINTQMNAIIKANPGLIAKMGKDRIIPEGLTVNLPPTTSEAPLTLSNYDIIGTDNYKPEGQKLSSKQVKLRDSIDDKTSYVSDGSTSLVDLALASGDTVHPINITVNRDGHLVKITTAYPNKDGVIGVRLKSEEINIPTKNLASAISGSWKFLYRNTAYMVIGLKKLVLGQIPIDDMHGIVAITKVGGDVIQQKGIWQGLLLTALISMDLAIVNLLPIPALDGGHLLFLLIEKLRGRPVEEKTQETFAKYGFAFLIGLMVFIIFNDIFALLTDKL